MYVVHVGMYDVEAMCLTIRFQSWLMCVIQVDIVALAPDSVYHPCLNRGYKPAHKCRSLSALTDRRLSNGGPTVIFKYQTPLEAWFHGAICYTQALFKLYL
jgi:hypothetical protein